MLYFKTPVSDSGGGRQRRECDSVLREGRECVVDSAHNKIRRNYSVMTLG